MVVAKSLAPSSRPLRNSQIAGSSTVEAYGATDVGLLRRNNEDSFGVHAQLGLFVVCDGMGGHAAGDVAAALAVEAVLDEFAKRHKVTPMACDDSASALPVIQHSALRSAVRRAHNTIAEAQCRNPQHADMGTTIAAMKVTSDKVIVAHVGDSRIYRWHRDHGLSRETRDHSLFNQMVDEGRIALDAPEQNFPQRNVIMRALGARDHRAELRTLSKRPGDVFLLCSDGLTDMVDDHEIARILDWYEGAPKQTAKALVAAAIEADGRDNITVVVVRCQTQQWSDTYEACEADTERDIDIDVDALTPSEDTLRDRDGDIRMSHRISDRRPAKHPVGWR